MPCIFKPRPLQRLGLCCFEHQGLDSSPHPSPRDRKTKPRTLTPTPPTTPLDPSHQSAFICITGIEQLMRGREVFDGGDLGFKQSNEYWPVILINSMAAVAGITAVAVI
jgi:hypothetical protein